MRYSYLNPFAMLDLETLSLRPNATVISAAIVQVFDPKLLHDKEELLVKLLENELQAHEELYPDQHVHELSFNSEDYGFLYHYTAMGCSLNQEYQLSIGRHIDKSTQEFWDRHKHCFPRQRDKAVNVDKQKDLLSHVLSSGRHLAGRLPIYSNGAAFDLPIWDSLCEDNGTPGFKMDYRNQRCYRTLKAICPKDIGRVDCVQPHHALFDAIAQAQTLCRILDYLDTGVFAL